MNLSKILLAVSLDEVTQKPFQYLKVFPIPFNAEIQLVHMVPEIIYPAGLEVNVMPFPLKSERPQIEEEIKKQLMLFKQEIFPFHTNVTLHVIFDADIKSAFTEYVGRQNPELVVVATRGKRGMEALFDSSFAQHQLKYSTANVLVLR